MFSRFSFSPSTLLAFFLGGLLLGSRLVFGFTEPSSAPPLNNTPAPLNVSSTGQSKSGGLILNTGGAPNGLIVQNGNVGIGTASPARKLQVSEDAISVDRTASGAAHYILSKSGVEEWSLVLDASQNLSFYENNATSRVTFQNGGNVGIGTQSPSQKLDVAGYIKAATGLCIGSDCRTSWPSTSAETDPTVISAVKDGVTLDEALGYGNSSSRSATFGELTVNGSANITGTIRGASYGFGGIYRLWPSGACANVNPFTAGCSCPGGFTSNLFVEEYGTRGLEWRIYFCYK